jgi:hypothetical protein
LKDDKEEAKVVLPVQEFLVALLNDAVVLSGRLEFKSPLFIQAF